MIEQTKTFIARVSLNNFDAIMTAFFRNIGMIDSTSDLSVRDVIVDTDEESVMIEAERTNESIQ